MQEHKNQLRSSVIIARLLDSEGFTDFTANQVERYWRRNIGGLTSRQKNKLKKIDGEVSELMKDKTAAERMLIGRFIGLHKKMSFDVGLRIGITAFAVKNDKQVFDDEPSH